MPLLPAFPWEEGFSGAEHLSTTIFFALSVSVCGLKWLHGSDDFQRGMVANSISAGSETINFILSLTLPNPDDGKVSVENTKLEGMKDHITLPVSHPFLMKHDAVIGQVLHFLAAGKFEHEDAKKPTDS